MTDQAAPAKRREAPDRNLALELVRVTEAGAMAAGRWVGRGDKEGGDGAAVDAMRQLVNSVSMRGVVVIGEGEKDNAPMLYNGEEVGNGDGPGVRLRGRPHRRHHADEPRACPTRSRCSRWPSAARCSTRRRCSTWTRSPCGPDAADVIDITAPIAENIRRVAKVRKASTVADITVCVLDRPRHTELMADVREAGARIRLHLRRRRRRRDLGVPARLRHRPARRHRRHPGGDHHRRGDPLYGRRDPGQLWPAPTTPSGRRPSTRVTTSTGCSRPTTWCPGTTCSSAPPGSPTATCSRACASSAAAAPPSRS